MKELISAAVGTLESDWQAWPGLQALESITAIELVSSENRLVILAPHPDDEILMVGGLLQQLCAQGNRCLLIAATDGEASHPGSVIWPTERLRTERPKETLNALQRIDTGNSRVEIVRLRLPDSALSQYTDTLQNALLDILTAADVVFTTWALDGHPDHEVCGRSAAVATSMRSARLIEVPVWMWHWAVPTDLRVPWSKARRLSLSSDQIERKQTAMAAFHSQVGKDLSTGREAVVPSSMLARMLRTHEIFFL